MKISRGIGEGSQLRGGIGGYDCIIIDQRNVGQQGCYIAPHYTIMTLYGRVCDVHIMR